MKLSTGLVLVFVGWLLVICGFSIAADRPNRCIHQPWLDTSNGC